MDIRCEFCNWLNKYVGSKNFVCHNCKQMNGIIEAKYEVEKKKNKDLIKLKKGGKKWDSNI